MLPYNISNYYTDMKDFRFQETKEKVRSTRLLTYFFWCRDRPLFCPYNF